VYAPGATLSSQYQRVPQRRAVTIGIGFHCRDGIVLAADQQQTVEGYYKIHSTKLGNIVYEGATILWTYSHLPNLVTVMKDGVFAKLPNDSTQFTVNNIAEAVYKQIAEMKAQYPIEMADQQFLFALSCGAALKFIRVSGGIVDEPHWACIGVGDSSLVNYIIKVFGWRPPIFMDAGDALTLAVYVIHLAKQFVDRVGGPTDAIILRNDGAHPDFVTSQQIKHLEDNFETMEFLFRDVYNVLTNPAIPQNDLERPIARIVEGIKAMKKQWG
jgi:20S proteasome alpha/beta subunit